MAARLPSRMLWAQISSPVFASRAITERRVPAVAYSTPLIMSGVPSSLYSGRGPRLSVLKRQATDSLLKLDALTWSSGEYLVPLRSAVYCGHSPLFVEGCGAARDCPVAAPIKSEARKAAQIAPRPLKVTNLVVRIDYFSLQLDG